MKSRKVLSFVFACILLSAIGGDTFSENETFNAISEFRYARVSVPGATLNLRRHASSTSSVIDRIPNDTVIVVESQNDGWCEVLYNSKEGFVSAEFLVFIDKHPYETISKGDSGQHVLDLKRRMRELGYFRPGAYDLDDYFSVTSENRLKILQKANGLEETGIASPELQAFIFMGPVKKNTAILPPAPYYVAPTATPTPTAAPTATPASATTATPTAAPTATPAGPTDKPTAAPAPSLSPTPPPTLELSVDISNMNTSFGTSGTYVSSKTEFNYVISGGSPPYSVNASFSIQSDTSSPHTKTVSGGNGAFVLLWAVADSSSLSGRTCSLTLVVTDNLGHTVSDTFNSIM